MTIVDPLRVAAIIRDVALSVILPRYRNLTAVEIREKRPGDLVTIADTEAETILSHRFRELLPDSRVVGEESVAGNPQLLEELMGAAPVWLIDPVDGTANFVSGRDEFAVIVALVIGGCTVQGWIHDPLSNRTAIAEVGGGAWIGDSRLSVSPDGPIGDMQGSVSWRKREKIVPNVRNVVHLKSAGHDYLSLVEGRIQFAYYRRLHPWDHAAGVLLHHEAGGTNALLEGEPYRPMFSEAGLLLAPGPTSWESLRQILADA